MTLLPPARAALYSTTPARYAEHATALWRPMRSKVPDAPLDDPAWLTVPGAYVVCAADRTVRPDAQRTCASRPELDCDHSPFYSAPDALTKFLTAHAALLEAR